MQLYTLLHALVYWRLKPLRSSRCMIIDHCFEVYYDSGCERDQLHWYSIQDLICKFYDALKPNYQKLTSNCMQFHWTVIIIMIFWDYGAVQYIRYLFLVYLIYTGIMVHYIMAYNVAAPAIITKCKLFLHFYTAWKNIDNILHLQTDKIFCNPKKCEKPKM